MLRVILGLMFIGLPFTAISAAPDSALTSEPLAAHSATAQATLFTLCPPESTGIVTENNYAPPRLSSDTYKDPRMWADRYHEFEVGAVGTGVAIGDFDGDGRPDIFVVSKTESCRLFRNLGNWKFEDVTERAGVADHGDAAAFWKQGATFVDVNNDGRLDLYVCRFGVPNLLYINQGDGTFKEEAAARGLAVNDASVMAAFCDYDRDGWLDVYVQTNLLNGLEHPGGQNDYLFHNNGDGTFRDVSAAAGIRGETQGHSATWWDFNNDGWPDLYVANDFARPDSLYRNNRDGTFTDVIADVAPHVPYSSMGSDLGDVNNDGLIDLLVADMAATTHQKDQRGMAALRTQVQETPTPAGAPPQFARNALFLNTGVSNGRVMEAACLAGIAATDWTWAVRFEDLDNDGRLDLFVTNGMHREVHNLDQLQRLMTAQSPADRIRIEKSSPVLNEQNLAYRNVGDLHFEDVSQSWGLDERGVSFGAAFGDLDGDGDLDLVYTNFKKGVSVLRNDGTTGHRVIFALRGTRSNRFGVGAEIKIETASGMQVRQLVLARGVLSSSEPVLHFGLGADAEILRVTVRWPSGAEQHFAHLISDQKYTITEPRVDAAPATAVEVTVPLLREVSGKFHLALEFEEPFVDELSQQPLLPMTHNRCGPMVAAGDLNGDGRADLVIGGTTLTPACLVVGGAAVPLEGAAAAVNDGPVLIFDANGDGLNDVLVTHGGASLAAGSAEYQPRLWLNAGEGRMRPAEAKILPPLPVSVGAVCAADFNHDGKIDLFVGGRLVPGNYPATPPSALLVNRGDRFEDATEMLAPLLRTLGLVTAAVWSDVDGDGWADLIVATEWGNVRCLHNERGRGFEDWTQRAGFAAAGNGWWSSLATADFNGDGHPDFVVGNVGLNTVYHADAAHPALLFAGDFNGDGGEQLVEAYSEGEKLYPRRTRRALGAVIPGILKRFPKNDVFARATVGEILGEDKLAAAQRYAATELRSGVFLSRRDGTYAFQPLPRIAQISPIQSVVVCDVDGDGKLDVLAVQNSNSPIPYAGHFDGGLGVVLRGDGRGGFTAMPANESGLVVPGDARGITAVDLDGDGRNEFLVTRNGSTSLVFQQKKSPAQTARTAP